MDLSDCVVYDYKSAYWVWDGGLLDFTAENK